MISDDEDLKVKIVQQCHVEEEDNKSENVELSDEDGLDEFNCEDVDSNFEEDDEDLQERFESRVIPQITGEENTPLERDTSSIANVSKLSLP